MQVAEASIGEVLSKRWRYHLANVVKSRKRRRRRRERRILFDVVAGQKVTKAAAIFSSAFARFALIIAISHGDDRSSIGGDDF